MLFRSVKWSKRSVTIVTVSVAERSPVLTVADEILRQAQNDIFYVGFEAIRIIHSIVFGMRADYSAQNDK